MSASCLPHRSASFDAEVVGRCRKALGPTFFEIRVAAPGRESFLVLRRYSCFLALHCSLRPLLPELPPMPRKSQLHKRLSHAFMEDRERALGELLCAIMSLRADASDCALRHFLGLAEDVQPRPHDALLSVADLMGDSAEPLRICREPSLVGPQVTDLSVVLEDEDEDEDLDIDENSSLLWDAGSLGHALEKLRLQNAQLEAENIKISRELSACATGVAAS